MSLLCILPSSFQPQRLCTSCSLCQIFSCLPLFIQVSVQKPLAFPHSFSNTTPCFSSPWRVLSPDPFLLVYSLSPELECQYDEGRDLHSLCCSSYLSHVHNSAQQIKTYDKYLLNDESVNLKIPENMVWRKHYETKLLLVAIGMPMCN